MLNLFSFSATPPRLKNLPLEPYLLELNLDRLVFGVDNIHFDVHISPQLCNALEKTASLLLLKHSQAGQYHKGSRGEYSEREKEILKRLCTQVLQDGINRAKMESEHQIDYLGQAALAKLFLEEVRNQYRNLVDHFEQQVRANQLSPKHADVEGFRLKEKLAEIKLNSNRLIRLAGEELFELLTDIQNRKLRNMRETHFHAGQILPAILFNNPVLHTNNPADDFFLIEEYVLLGKRAQDPDSYDNVKTIMYDLLAKTDLSACGMQDEALPSADKENALKSPSALNRRSNIYDRWIMEAGNVEQMFDFLKSHENLEAARGAKASRARIRELVAQKKNRQRFLNFFYRAFKKSGLLKRIVAAFEMKPVYEIYCPPMTPRQIREYLVNIWSRRSITRQLKRRKSFRGSDFPMAPLTHTIRRIRGTFASEEKIHLLNFLKEFFRYHRDLHNARILVAAMESIHLVTEEKTLQLSRGNRSVYEYLLPGERGKEEKPVRNHVIIKADIRGSIRINHIMRTRGLNPASLFSLNFFDPISELLWNYDAAKVFIEGDAIILSIFENEDTPEGWYSVARACGLAIRILQIVQRYNVKNQENNLPILELGIGICYSPEPPAYLFDGDSRIMISPAINMADRLSSCNKNLGKHLRDQGLPHNLYVFKNVQDDHENTIDDFSLRYNVNGIELSAEGFAKLACEIKLKKVAGKVGSGDGSTFYSGKVPTLSGHYQKLVIRESPVYEVNPETFKIAGTTKRKYYEICTNRKITDYVKGLDDSNGD
ncbi:MAG: hypothetical protein R6W75_08285 [Smithellaceae bacterium]